jgi:hypothetical protein
MSPNIGADIGAITGILLIQKHVFGAKLKSNKLKNHSHYFNIKKWIYKKSVKVDCFK